MAIISRHSRVLIVTLFISVIISLGMTVSVFAGDGAETVTRPDSDGVTNPAAKIELVNPAEDANFYLYRYNGDQALSFPENDYPYYDQTHTVTVRLTGVDPEKECDDNIAFFSGNECDVVTESQDKTGGNIRTVTVRNSNYGGPAPYTVIASSGVEVKSLFLPVCVLIPDSLSLNMHEMKMDRPSRRLMATLNDVSWSSSNSKVAVVSDSGLVTAVSDGKAVITVSYDRYGVHMEDSCTVTVGEEKSQDTAPVLKKGSAYKAGSGTSKAYYRITDLKKKTVAYKKCASSSSKAAVPDTVKLKDGKTYTVKSIDAKAFKSSSKVKTLSVKAKSLTKKSVKNCLKSSKVKTVKTIKYKTYKSYFKKANCGRKVVVKKI